MEAVQDGASGLVRRRYERIGFSDQAVLELPGGRTLHGLTRDVSLHGLSLNLTETPAGVHVGQQGLLRLFAVAGDKEFPCRVVHVSGHGVGIELLDASRSFSANLTDSLMKETQLRLGVELGASEDVRVLCHSGAAVVECRLLKIAVDQLLFLAPSLSGFAARGGDAIDLEIRHGRLAPFALTGRVRSVQIADSRMDERLAARNCTVALSGLSEKSLQAIRELIRTIHDGRSQGVMPRAPTSLPAGNGPQSPRSSRVLQKDFERLFGPNKS